ncbi:acyl-CoA synthetase [Acidisphaera sp. S103]|uniref:acyl-CoA synthetase n=1 Tax=Acidisphaera sp. S103 TaxID=1747223 RepID=UPI00131BE8B1|nr:AMP-binding protein [Acidisphaera sp. S103]
MPKLTDYTSYADAQRLFSTARLWDLFDGNRERLNIGHECVDRHAVPGRVALRIAHADGQDETISFVDLAIWSSRFAHWLADQGVAPGDRVAIMLEPSLPFYAALFGSVKHGAIAVPLFTLFGADGVRLRTQDCSPTLLLTTREKADALAGFDGPRVVVADDAFMAGLAAFPDEYKPRTAATDLAIFQYTSGTTREMPDAIRHTHRAVVVVMNAALYGTGLRPRDRFFCPSSPAWGHGLWHGTLAPLALGIETGAYAGRFDTDRLLQALGEYRTTNLSAAATHYRMMKNSGRIGDFGTSLRKLSFTGEPIDPETSLFIQDAFRTKLCSMYGTTEVGVVLANYPGAADFLVKEGALGRPVPGVEVEVQRPDGSRCEPDELGEIKVRRHDAWFPTKDRGRVDSDGYFYHAGRADDVIISAGWTMSAVEIENALLRHPAVQAAAVIGVPDALRGLVVKAFIVPVAGHATDDSVVADIQSFVRTRLSQHEYPRLVAFVADLPRTPAGKINRKALRDQEAIQQRKHA